MRAFSSEWVKLSRPATLFGFGGTMIGFALLFTIMAFESAGGRNIDLDGSGSESFVTAAMLSLPESSILVVTDMAVFLGIVARPLRLQPRRRVQQGHHPDAVLEQGHARAKVVAEVA